MHHTEGRVRTMSFAAPNREATLGLIWNKVVDAFRVGNVEEAQQYNELYELVENMSTEEFNVVCLK
jgi:hypothetical protein